VRINDREVVAEPNETVLQAALRAGIALPSGCRVGGCGACKCRLAEGEVRELTETGYLLTQEELDQRTILACQSVPRTDVHIVVVSDAAARVRGKITARERLTHDIVRVRVALDTALAFRAGQFVSLALDGLPGVTRCYSFAAPPADDHEVSFIVRKVPGGQLSPHLVDADDAAVLGRAVELSGVAGDLTLRPGSGPLVLVAGGSGLGPLLALLKQAALDGETRPFTLYFGAREARDLYCADELEALGRALPGGLRVVPVLSAAPEGDGWTGERGLVTEKLPARAAGAQAYLCGPPAMIDAAIPALLRAGVAREDIHADRFTTLADAPAQVTKAAEGAEPAPLPWALEALHTLKFSLFHLVGLAATASLLAGGRAVTAGLVGVLALYILGDAVAGDDTSTPKLRHARGLTAQLWLALPLLALVVFSAVWSVSPGDPLGYGAWLGRLTGHDFLAARDATTLGHHVSAVVLTGLMIGMIGTIPAHELTHRTWDRASMAIGRWLLAFSFDTSFAIEHVYGHHRYVSTAHDPATAPRGRSVYFHVVASTLKGNVSAWNIEASRLKKRKLALLGWHNAFLRGHAMSAALVVAAWALGGPRAALFFAACALWGKALLEIVNYMEHYGMVRDPSTPVAPRHSWNTNRLVSSWSMFNLTRHSHHHAAGEVPYHELRPYPDAPMMIHGYLTTIVIALVPPLWHRLMTPKVLAWDRDHATAAERRLAALANARSGHGAFTARATSALAGHAR